MQIKEKSFLQNPYLPGIIMFVIALIIGLVTYQDYGMSWDEPGQRAPAILSYDYIFHGSQALFTKENDNHGAGFELLLIFIEKGFKLTDSRDIYMMRHIVTHVFFLCSMLAAYVLIYRLFKDRFLACLGFFMIAFMPRLYAHSFFNTKDMPFLSMIIILFAYAQYAFEKNKPALFLVLGLICGYATSIRIMGVLPGGMIIVFLLIDQVMLLRNKQKSWKPLMSMLLFTVGFCVLLYASWPYIWRSPVVKFIESYHKMASYDWHITVLFGSNLIYCTKLPWTYFPVWFWITVPELWLITGFIGIVFIAIDFFKKPMDFIQNTINRNFLMYVICFFVPIFAVIILHSVIYDDWRHLYFVYPSFVLMAVYFIDKMLKLKYKKIVQGVCLLQVALVIVFMVQNHPFNQVYFNNFISHDDEYLRKNYELEYWGCSFKQGLDHLLEVDPSKKMKICCEYKSPLENNIMMLHPEDRSRFEFSMFDTADYYMSNFRLHPQDYPGTDIDYEIKVLNSTIFRIYRLKKTAGVQLH
jgi:dolichyl-phosphate-mannose-protein mannosyltransferase